MSTYEQAIHEVFELFIKMAKQGTEFDPQELNTAVNALGSIITQCHKKEFNQKKVDFCLSEVLQVYPKLKEVIEYAMDKDWTLVVAEAIPLLAQIMKQIQSCKNYETPSEVQQFLKLVRNY